MYELTISQIKKGHDIHLIMPRYGDIPKISCKVHMVRWGRSFPSDDYSVRGRLNLYSNILLFELSAFFSAILVSHRYKVDIFHLHGDWSMSCVAALLKMVLKKPVILTIHASMKHGIWTRMGRFAKIPFSVINNIIVVSSEIKNQLVSKGVSAEKIHVISSGVNIKEYGDNNRISVFDQKKILFMGRLRKMKGVNVLIESMAIVLKKFPNLNLILMGEGPERENLERLVTNLGIKSNVIFTGYLYDESKIQMMKSSTIFVMPSIDSEQEGEGRPKAIIEAMAMGLPIIASDVGGISEFIRHMGNGLLIKSNDPISLSDAIVQLMGDSSLRTSLGQTALKDVSQFDWDVIVKKIDCVYAIFHE